MFIDDDAEFVVCDGTLKPNFVISREEFLKNYRGPESYKNPCPVISIEKANKLIQGLFPKKETDKKDIA